MPGYSRLPLTLLLAGAATIATAGDIHDFAIHGVADDASRYILMTSDNKWANNTVPWYYNPANAPLSESDFLTAMNGATSTWQAASGITFQYMGTTTQALSNANDDKLVVGWMEQSQFIANYGDVAGYGSIWWDGYNITDGEVALNAGGVGVTNPSDLQGLLTHELGHILALNHSDVQDSVMYANPYNTLEFMRTLRADDISAITSLYPVTTTGTTTDTTTGTTTGTTTDTTTGTTTDTTTALATLAFDVQSNYAVGSTLAINLTETGGAGSTGPLNDMWLAILTPSGALLYVDATGSFTGTPTARYSNVGIESSFTFNTLSLTVPAGIGGTYTLYAVYVSPGANPLTGGTSVFRSSLASAAITLANQ